MQEYCCMKPLVVTPARLLMWNAASEQWDALAGRCGALVLIRNHPLRKYFLALFSCEADTVLTLFKFSYSYIK